MKKLESEKTLKLAKKIKAINYLGGECKKCGEKNIFKLTFHHKDPNEKEFEYGEYRDRRWSFLESELDKCELLCQNCHREFHYNQGPLKFGNSRRIDKAIYLEYSGGRCIKCGYNKCPSSLTFHHRDPKEKKFWIGGLNERVDSVVDLDDRIKEEIDKCDLLCANCHTIEHSDIEFFEKNKDRILNKVEIYKEKQNKIDRCLVFEMYKNGNRQSEIAKYFKASKGTISDIIRLGE